MTKTKVYIVGTSSHYANFIKDSTLVKTIEEADIVIFTGGEDVHPSFYKEEKGSKTYSNLGRDFYEVNEFKEAQKLNKFCLGICRGAQFLTVMSGGKLIQHVTNHGLHGTHIIEFSDGDKLPITSTHHQMCYPFNLLKTKYDLLAWSENKLSETYLNGENKEIELDTDFVEPEIIFYYETKCLAIQGHPEMMDSVKYQETINKINRIINDCRSFIERGVF
jgi:GMP synthase-like glutamine amidotransferase